MGATVDFMPSPLSASERRRGTVCTKLLQLTTSLLTHHSGISTKEGLLPFRQVQTPPEHMEYYCSLGFVFFFSSINIVILWNTQWLWILFISTSKKLGNIFANLFFAQFEHTGIKRSLPAPKIRWHYSQSPQQARNAYANISMPLKNFFIKIIFSFPCWSNHQHLTKTTCRKDSW